MNFSVGDTLILKKPHPCGCREWEVLRTGSDIKIKCKGCSHTVMVCRDNLEKRITEVLKND